MADREISIENVLLIEYERLKEEQKTRIGFRDNLIYATLAAMAGVVAATLTSNGDANLLLLLPPASTVLGWTYLANDEKVSAIGRYIRQRLGPKIDPVAGDVFGWEIEHRSDDRRRVRKVLQLVADLGTFCIPACSAIVIYWINGPWWWPFVVVSIVELIVVIGLAIEFVRYADVGVGGDIVTTPDS
ncbi:hypothetical protein K1W54_08515 [Micromonospora sp. CPCC 205371]|nr:hypothetical protein [Micromonospora sp. CPCC 205371]